jgi:hypothetical protein
VYPLITQFVFNHDIAYHAGNYWFNQHSIGIEHVGFADSPDGWYTQRMYDASAQLAGYLAWIYGIPIDRAHILGHDNVPAPAQSFVAGMHWDPGQWWDWPYYLSRVGYYYAQWSNGAAPPAAEVPSGATAPAEAIRTVTTGSEFSTAGDIPAWSAGAHFNFTDVYADANGVPSSELVLGASDPASWTSPTTYDARDFACDNLPAPIPNGGGTWSEDRNSDLRAKAEVGLAYARTGTYTDAVGVLWDRINFNGVSGWIRDSETMAGWGVMVTFKGGASPTTVYGKPILTSVICSDATSLAQRSGQRYVAQAQRIDASTGTVWYEIAYGHRLVWVPSSEVSIG